METATTLRPPRLPGDLRRAFEGAQRVLVLSHANPDPDALASAYLLQRILQHLHPQANATVAYGGIIGRAENRAMLRELGLAPLPLATAAFYALRTETQDLGREAGEADRHAFADLLLRTDGRVLARIQRARVPRNYFRAFRHAIHRARIHGRAVISDLGRVDTPDIIAEIADFLLRLEGVDWTCCLGRHGEPLVV